MKSTVSQPFANQVNTISPEAMANYNKIKNTTMNAPAPLIFQSGALNFKFANDVSPERQQQLIQEAFKRMGTPGTKENQQLRVVVNGKQNSNIPL